MSYENTPQIHGSDYFWGKEKRKQSCKGERGEGPVKRV
jgi:hypothetical protein